VTGRSGASVSIRAMSSPRVSRVVIRCAPGQADDPAAVSFHLRRQATTLLGEDNQALAQVSPCHGTAAAREDRFSKRLSINILAFSNK
jgi:hypothetical protein